MIVNMIDYGMDPQTALEAPRFCIKSGDPNGLVSVEEGISEEVVATLKKMGHSIEVCFFLFLYFLRRKRSRKNRDLENRQKRRTSARNEREETSEEKRRKQRNLHVC